MLVERPAEERHFTQLVENRRARSVEMLRLKLILGIATLNQRERGGEMMFVDIQYNTVHIKPSY